LFGTRVAEGDATGHSSGAIYRKDDRLKNDDTKPPKPGKPDEKPGAAHAPKPEKHDKPDGKPTPKRGPNDSGPKEREHAIELTLAVLNVAEFPKSDPMAIADATEDVYRRMLALIGPAGPQPLVSPKPPGSGDELEAEGDEDSAE